MKKFFTSKTFVVSVLAVLCVGIAATCVLLNRDKPGDFVPDPQESQGVSEWRENPSSTTPAGWDTPDAAGGGTIQ